MRRRAFLTAYLSVCLGTVLLVLGRGSAGRDLAGAATPIPPVRQTESADEPSPSPPLPPDYWHRPLMAQGEAPRGWSGLERSLAPESCGTCHSDRYEEWRSSLHAKAFSPGLVGQLLRYSADEAAVCLDCHAPLAEQKQAFEEGRARHADADPSAAWGLASAGNSCAGCHVRRHRRHGPPQRDTGATGASDPSAPHGGVFRSDGFEDSEFCAACHQHPQAYAVNGKPLENTLAEWRESPQAAQGITCQQCHMPDRQHLWRGVHDPAMVASGLTAAFRAEVDGAHFDLTNSGVGHAFPTYITPKAVMRAVALDAAGNPLPETARSRLIQRVVRFVDGRWVEHLDSRLLPSETADLALPWQGSGRVRMWLEVDPDDFYDHEVYDSLLEQHAEDSAVRRLIMEADGRAHASRFRLFETELVRPK